MANLVTAKQARTRLGVGRSTFYKERNAGRLAVIYIGRRAYVEEKELERYVASLPRYRRVGAKDIQTGKSDNKNLRAGQDHARS